MEESSATDINRISNPYFISPSENPTLVLVSSLLDGINYHSWSRAMKMALISKNKLKFVDGSIKKPPESDPLFPVWERSNILVLGWIQRSIIPSIAQSILWIDTAKDAWNDLCNRFSQGDYFRISDLHDEISSIRQGELSVSEYYTNLKVLQDELLQFRPVPACSCAIQCSCNAFKQLKAYQDNDCVIRFLKGLNPCFQTVRSQILLLDPLPNINKVFSMVVQQERQLNSTTDTVDGNIFFNKQLSNEYKSGGNKKFHNMNTRFKCAHCGRLGHSIDKCYKLHGFPPGFSIKNKNQGSSYAHTSSANHIQTQSIPDTPLSVTSGNNFPFTAQQCEQLLALLQTSQKSVNSACTIGNDTKGKTIAQGMQKFTLSGQRPYTNIDAHTSTNSNYWILDSGATDHISCSLFLLNNVRSISGILIGLPNGERVLASHIGNVQLSAHITLTDVLYIPNFSHNLISVSKLTQDKDISILINANFCHIQKFQRTIGVADERGGLYYMSHSSSNTSVSSMVPHHNSFLLETFDLWHFRLGHVPSSKIQQLSSIDSSIKTTSNDHCSVCPLAKHKRLPFPSSTTTTTRIFDIIHVDVWGPFATPTLKGQKYFLTIVDDFSRNTWVILMKSKSEVPNLLKYFFKMVDTQFSLQVKCIRTDNGQEFSMDSFLNSVGILHQRSCVETPQQNSVVERKHQHISMWLEVFSFNQVYHFISGEIAFSPQFISLIVFLLVFLVISLLMNFFIINNLLTLIYVSLVVYVMQVPYTIIEQSFNLVPLNAFFLDILILQKDTNVMIFLITVLSSLVM